MFTCDRYTDHHFLPCGDPSGRAEGGGQPICLSCLQATVDTAPLDEVTLGLRAATASLTDEALPRPPHRFRACVALLRDVVLQLMRRMAHSPSANAVPSALLELCVGLAEVLAAEDAQRGGVGERVAAHHGPTRGAEEKLGGGSVPVLGMTQASDETFPPPPTSWPASVAGPTPCEGTTLLAFAGDMLAEYAQTLREARRPGVAEATALLADVLERSTPLRQALASDAALLSVLVQQLFCQGAILRQKARTVECFAFALHLVFTEAAQDPLWLEQLAGVVEGAAAGADGAENGLLPAAAAALERFGEDGVVVTNLLSLLHFALSYATTAERLTATDCDEVLRAATPLLLSPSEHNAALSCEVMRLALAAQRRTDCVDRELLEWIEDYALEGLQQASARGVFAVLALLDEVALSQGTEPCRTDAGERGAVVGRAGRLLAFRRVASLSSRAVELAVTGSYLRRLVRCGGVDVEDVGAFACAMAAPPPCRDSTNDDEQASASEGCAEPLSLRCIVALAELLSQATAGDATLVAPEHAACLSHALATRLACSGEASPASPNNGDSPPSPPRASLVDDVAADTLLPLLQVVGFFYGNSPELHPVALLALRDDVVQDAALHHGAITDKSCSSVSRSRALLRIATQLVRHRFQEEEEGVCVLSPHAARELSRLARLGLFDSLLRVSAAVAAQDSEVEELRAGLVFAVAGARQPPARSCRRLRPSGVASSMREVVLDMFHNAEVKGDGAGSAAEGGSASTLAGRVLMGLAALGCEAPVSSEELSAFILAGFGGLPGDHTVDELRTTPAGTDNDDSAPHVVAVAEAIAASVLHVMRLSVLHLHWFGAAPTTPLIVRAGDGDATTDRGTAAANFSHLCTEPLIRRAVAACTAAQSWPHGEVAFPSMEEGVRGLLHQPWGFALGVHLCLATALETCCCYCCSGAAQGGGVGEKNAALTSDACSRLLVECAFVDDGGCLLATAFRVIRRSRRTGDDMGLGILRYLMRWLNAVAQEAKAGRRGAAAASEQDSRRRPRSIERIALCLLERHCAPLVLTWNANGFVRHEGGDATGNFAADDVREAQLACAITHLVVESLSHLEQPTAGSGSDAVLIRWCIRGLSSETVEGSCFLQLYCLLLERSHGPELARRFGTALLATVSETSVTTAVLAGVIQFLVVVSSSPRAGLWRSWHQLMPISQLALLGAEHRRRGDTKSACSREIAVVVRGCEYIFLRCFPISVPRDPSASLDAASAPLTLPDAEYRAVQCVLDWCIVLLLSASATSAGCTGTSEDYLCGRSACRVLHFLLRAYRASVGCMPQLPSLLLLCERGRAVLPARAMGWVLAGLLYVSPAATTPFSERAAALSRHFLSTLAPSTFPASSSRVGSEEEEESATREMLAALTAACDYYAAAVGDAAPPFPLHRAKDFFPSQLPSPHCGKDGDKDVVCGFLARNKLNVDLTTS